MRSEHLIVLVIALVCAAVAVMAMGTFQPLPLFLGLIAMGAFRTWRASRTSASSKAL